MSGSKIAQKRFLIVDDDFLTTQIFHEILTHFFPDVTCKEATDFWSAIELFHECPFDLLITDMLLGDDNPSGIDLVKRLCDEGYDFRCIAVTAYPARYGYQAGSIGIHAFLEKPISSAALAQEVRMQLDIHTRHISKPIGSAFCVTPFASQYTDTYLYGIKAAAEAAGYTCERVDEKTFTQDVLKEIHRAIRTADVVIADLTDNNSNVFYEVGYALGRSKKVVMLVNDSEKVDFDLRGFRHIVYHGHIYELRPALYQTLIDLTDIPSKRIGKKRRSKQNDSL